MKNTLFKKGLVIGIIILLVGVSVLSSASSKDVSVYNDKIVDDNNKVELLEDNQKEIYTIFENVNVNHIEASDTFLNYFFGFVIGWIKIYCGVKFTIKGYKRPIFPRSESWFKLNVGYVYAPFFIGRCSLDWDEPFWYYVNGIAYGNIEWESEW